MEALELWRRFKQQLLECPSVAMRLDISRMDFPDTLFSSMEPAVQQAFQEMADLEAGEIANPDESRMVGHYWLRTPHKAPSTELTEAIERAHVEACDFARQVHERQLTPPKPENAESAPQRFTDLLLIGIGGSALGPQLVGDALGSKKDKLTLHFLDNTDPDGFDRTLNDLGARLKSTLVLVVSKSGGTAETRNGMIETRTAFEQAGLHFPGHAVAITMQGSKLDQQAEDEGWLARFPMWDWVGGRTSITSVVGLAPMALQGLDTESFLAGAAEMDELTRNRQAKQNPAAVLALMWHHATAGHGEKDMVILPYKDRLLLLSRYLQQLVMESLGKELDLDGNTVNQGIAVYGNKGSTDQHAYVQQLREGVANFFVTFLVVLQDRNQNAAKKAPEVNDGITSGDYLSGFWQGTRSALYEKGRGSVTITLERLDAFTLGALIALYERTVGLYASLIRINAYHQPGVEAGKKAANSVLEVQQQLVAYLREHPEPATPEQLADRMNSPQQVETIYHVLEHLAANRRGVVKSRGKYRFKEKG